MQGERASSRGFYQARGRQEPPRNYASPQSIMAGSVVLWICNRYPSLERSLTERSMDSLLKGVEGVIAKDLKRLEIITKGAEDVQNDAL